ncbi:MAG: hypothetical protein NVS4B8_01850 [Herpetosiphon sp.]
MELEDNILVIRRIHVTYHLVASPESQATVERVHGIHHMSCPVYRTLHKAIDITTEYTLKSDA